MSDMQFLIHVTLKLRVLYQPYYNSCCAAEYAVNSTETRRLFGQGNYSGVHYLSSVACLGNESDLLNCSSTILNSTSPPCAAVGVHCGHSKWLLFQVCMVMSHSNTCRLKLYYNNIHHYYIFYTLG